MNNLIRHITSLIFISFFLSAYPISYSFRGLSETNGLSDLTVSALYKDSVGYLWIGTATSVECFERQLNVLMASVSSIIRYSEMMRN